MKVYVVILYSTSCNIPTLEGVFCSIELAQQWMDNETKSDRWKGSAYHDIFEFTLDSLIEGNIIDA